MENLQIIARALGLQLNKRGNVYLINRGGYSFIGKAHSGIEFDNLHRVSIHLAKKAQDMRSQLDTE